MTMTEVMDMDRMMRDFRRDVPDREKNRRRRAEFMERLLEARPPLYVGVTDMSMSAMEKQVAAQYRLNVYNIGTGILLMFLAWILA